MNEQPAKKSFTDAFKVEDQESCEKAIKNGGIAAMISAAMTGAMSAASLFTASEDKALSYLMNPLNFFDAALLVVLGIFVFRKSRTASTILFIYFVAAKALMWSELGKPTGVFVSLIFFLFYFTAMRATYIWHSQYKNALSHQSPD